MSRGHFWATQETALPAANSSDNTANPTGLPIFGTILTNFASYGYFEQASVNEQANPHVLTMGRDYTSIYQLYAAL